MPGSAAQDAIDLRIESRYAELSPQEQRAADFILEHLSDLATFTATELASSSGVSKATVSRLFRRLGFADASEVRDQARAARNPGAPTVPRGTGTGSIALHFAAEEHSFGALAESLSPAAVSEAARLVTSARTVVIVGFRNGYPLALHLRQQLAQARNHVRLAPLPGQSLGEDLAGLNSRDVVVLFGFRRRPEGFDRLVAALSDVGIPFVLIADSSARRYSGQARVWLDCPLGGMGAFDSYAAPMSLINLLASEVLALRARGSRQRVEAISDLYETLGELELSAVSRRSR
jgi:DNA-binding MurR/RpiR family transcriptional regulator